MSSATKSTVLALATMTLIGCNPLATFPDPGPLADRLPDELDANMPAALRFVMNNAERFENMGNGDLRALDPGTEIDDLSGLTGCWGATAAYINPDKAAVYLLQQFNDDGTFEQWIMSDTVGVVLASGRIGPFAVGPGAEMSLMTTTNPGYGYIWDGEDVDAESVLDGELGWSENLFPPRTLDYLVTLDGDRLRMVFQAQERAPSDHGDDMVYYRFDCPAE